MPLPLLLLALPAAKVIAVKAGIFFAHHAVAGAAHQAAYAVGAHAGNQVLAHAGTHLARHILTTALAAGSILGAIHVISATRLAALVYYSHVEGYRKLNHLDHNGDRKVVFSQINGCDMNRCDW